MTVVSTMATTKNDRIYIRVSSQIKEEFEKVANYRGLTPSTLLHSLVVKTIHEARQFEPQAFRVIEPEDRLEPSDSVIVHQKPEEMTDETEGIRKKKTGKGGGSIF